MYCGLWIVSSNIINLPNYYDLPFIYLFFPLLSSPSPSALPPPLLSISCTHKHTHTPFLSDLALKLPFTLTHSQPKERVISQLVTLPPRPLPSSSAGTTSDEAKETKAAGPEASVAGNEVKDKDKAAEAAAGKLSLTNNKIDLLRTWVPFHC